MAHNAVHTLTNGKTDKLTVFITEENWKQGQNGGWGTIDGPSCANGHISKLLGLSETNGLRYAGMDKSLVSEIIRLNDHKTLPLSYVKESLRILGEANGINFVFAPTKAELEQTAAVAQAKRQLVSADVAMGENDGEEEACV